MKAYRMGAIISSLVIMLSGGAFLVGAASANASSVVYATVTGYAPHSSAANQPSYWCANGSKVSPGGKTYVLPAGTYTKVIVKAGANQSGNFANTIFAAPPKAGQTVWADTNGNGVFDPDGPGGDKGISHVILCKGTTTSATPTPTTTSATPTPTTTSATPTPTESTPTPTPTTPTPTESTPTPTETIPTPSHPTTPPDAGSGGGLPIGLIGIALAAIAVMVAAGNRLIAVRGEHQ